MLTTALSEREEKGRRSVGTKIVLAQRGGEGICSTTLGRGVLMMVGARGQGVVFIEEEAHWHCAASMLE